MFIFGLSAGFWLGFKDGYKSANLLNQESQQYNAVAEHTTKVYSEPLLGSQVAGIILEGEETIVRETVCDFYYIRYLNSEHVPSSGWVLNSKIKLYSDVNQR